MIRVLLALLLLSCATSATWAQARLDQRDELRYDGSPFTYWESLLRTELKPEKRIEAVQALRAFGARGYAKEASVAIVELLKEFDYDEESLETGETESATDTAEQRLLRGALRALVKIGPEASNAMAPHLDHFAVRLAADALFGPGGKHGRPISELSLPALVQWITSTNTDARDVAIGMIAYTMNYAAPQKSDDYRKAFLDSLRKNQNEKAIVGALAQALDGRYEKQAATLLGILGARARPAAPALAKMLENSRYPGQALVTAYVKLEPDSSRAVRVLLMALERVAPDQNAVKPATYVVFRISRQHGGCHDPGLWPDRRAR